MTKKQEMICKRCGRCCLSKKVLWNGEKGRLSVVLNGEACPHLDKESKLCAVYPDRKKIRPQCLSVDQAIADKILPNNCPYVKDLKGYKTIVEDYPNE